MCKSSCLQNNDKDIDVKLCYDSYVVDTTVVMSTVIHNVSFFKTVTSHELHKRSKYHTTYRKIWSLEWGNASFIC